MFEGNLARDFELEDFSLKRPALFSKASGKYLPRGCIFCFDADKKSLDDQRAGARKNTATFVRASSATYWENGVLKTAEANVPRFERVAGKMGLLLEPAATNKCIQSRNLGAWTATGGPQTAQNAVGIDGVPNKAWTLGDDDTGAYEFFHYDVTVPDDTNYNLFSMFIRKDDNDAVFPLLGVLYPGGGSAYVQINTKTGATNAIGAASNVISSDDYGLWWRISIAVANDGLAHTTMRCALYPADGVVWTAESVAAVRSIIVDGAQVELNTKYPTSFIPTAGSEATRVTEQGYPTWPKPTVDGTYTPFMYELGPNRVTNGDFETYTGTADDATSDVWTGWSAFNNDGAGSKTLALTAVTLAPHGGSACVKLERTAGSVAYLKTYAAVTPGKHYVYGAWVQGDGTNAPYLQIQDASNGNQITIGNVSTSYTTAGTWWWAHIPFVAPAGCYSVALYIVNYTVSSSCYFDDVTLCEVVNALPGTTPQGTIILDVSLARPQTDPITTSLFAIRGGAIANAGLYTHIGGSVRFGDGTNISAVTYGYSRRTPARFTGRWGFLDAAYCGILQVGYGYTDGYIPTWDSVPNPYEGTFTEGTVISFTANALTQPIHIHSCWLFATVLAQAEYGRIR